MHSCVMPSVQPRLEPAILSSYAHHVLVDVRNDAWQPQKLDFVALFHQAAALRNVWQKLTAPNKGVEGTIFQALAFLLPLGLPLVIFRTVRSC